MTAMLIVTSEAEGNRLLPWAWMFARSAELPLTVIVASERDVGREWSEIESDESDAEIPALLNTLRNLAGVSPADAEASNANDHPPAAELTLLRLRDPAPDRAILEELPKRGAKLLVLPLDEPVRESEKTWQGRLYRQANCESIFLRVPGSSKLACAKILVPTAGGKNADAALRRANKMAQLEDGRVTALYVEPPVDVVAGEVGERVIERIVRRAIGRDAKYVEPQVALAPKMIDGVRQTMEAAHEHPYDLVLIGGYKNRTIRRVFFGAVSNELFAGPDAPAFAAVRAAFPIGTRSRQAVERIVQDWVPQLDREGRVSLVDRVQSSSKWNFDFVALICLSTLIAALGLARDQAPVVIGAMLVAPLMTPLVGAGLALVQGNYELIWSALQSVFYGFVLAFLIGCTVGALVPLELDQLTHEIIGRTSPGLVDLAVALVGGMAAAYALSRPNLSSALPGVAIAAALVPPIASAGIALARGEWSFARGATLLFLTNIVAIILGTAISLWLVGIRDTHQHGTQQKWSRRLAAFLLATSVGLAFAISDQAPITGRAALGELRGQIEDTIEQAQIGAALISVRQTGQRELAVVVESPDDELGTLPSQLRELANAHFFREDMRVKLEVRHIVTSGPPRLGAN